MSATASNEKAGVRRRLFLVVVMAVAAALAIMIVAFNVLLAHNLSADADRVLRSRATDELELLRLERGKLVVARSRERRGGRDQRLGLRRRSHARGAAHRGDHRCRRRQAARRPVRHRERSGCELEAVRQAGADRRKAPGDGRRRGLAGALLSDQARGATRLAHAGAGVLLLVVVAASWLLSSSLKPVTRMTRQAANWSDSELDRRFGYGEPYDELTELAATLDGRLDRLAASLRREKRFSAELSHELRTPLARVIAEADLALSRERRRATTGMRSSWSAATPSS